MKNIINPQRNNLQSNHYTSRGSFPIVLAFSLLLIISFFTTSLQAKLTQPVKTFPSLPLMQREAKFNEARSAFDQRSNLLLKGKHFENWKLNKPKAEIEKEFKRIEEWRTHSWYDLSGELLVSRPDFMISQTLLEKDSFRRPDLIAFDYNQTDGSYNSSNLIINDQKFLALEAPTNKTINQFFKLLQNFQVTQLVCLVSANDENGHEQSVPYWEERLRQEAKNQFIHVPLFGSDNKTFPIRFYSFEAFNQEPGQPEFETKSLLNLIQKARKDYDPEQGLLACHCSSGGGRTGTFLAGFILIQEIDRQLAAGTKLENIDISIEKIVMQLSLQRLNLVSKLSQYQTLYRLVDYYIQSKKAAAR